MAQISFRIDDDLKAVAEKTFKSMGMTLSTAITVFVTQAVKEQQFPFSIKAGGGVAEESKAVPRKVKSAKAR